MNIQNIIAFQIEHTLWTTHSKEVDTISLRKIKVPWLSFNITCIIPNWAPCSKWLHSLITKINGQPHYFSLSLLLLRSTLYVHYLRNQQEMPINCNKLVFETRIITLAHYGVCLWSRGEFPFGSRRSYRKKRTPSSLCWRDLEVLDSR